MKEMRTDDPPFGKGMIRADGCTIHPAFLFEVNSPTESKYPWDYYKLLATIPADEAFPRSRGASARCSRSRAGRHRLLQEIAGRPRDGMRTVLVPLAGIEPALLAELDFESSASTNSATGALTGRVGTGGI